MPDLRHSNRETFFWLEAAYLLDKADMPARVAKLKAGASFVQHYLADGAEVPSAVAQAEQTLMADFSRVRQSHALARTILIHLLRKEVSRDDMASGANEVGDFTSGPLRLDLKKVALAYVGATGRSDDDFVRHALLSGIITEKDVVRARRKRKRRPEFDANRLSRIPRFLVDRWCGSPGVYKEMTKRFKMPPLCFITNKAIVEFCRIEMGEDEQPTDGVLRQWITLLRLKRPRHPDAPKIREVKQHHDGIFFCS